MELWKSDGTEAGTVLVKDINPGSSPSNLGVLTKVNGTVFFSADDGTHGPELWKSDGTEAGTVLVKDINPGSGGSITSLFGHFTNVDGTVFFIATDGTHGPELWKSDGTEAGTVLVKDIAPGFNFSYPSDLTNVNGTLFFLADDGTHGIELWKSDGTDAGTTLVKDVAPGIGNSDSSDLTNVNGTLFFVANDGTHGRELWKSDGTEPGTVLVKDIIPGSEGAISSLFTDLTNVNGTGFFIADDGTHGYELWKSDGTEAGTVLVKDIAPAADSSLPNGLTNVNGTLFFNASDGTHSYELWKSDGTGAGTTLVKDIAPGIDTSYPHDLASVNGTLFFVADDGMHGDELWKSDGTGAGTTLVKDINSYGSSSDPDSLTNVNGTLFFGAIDSKHGDRLWKSDGSVAGTVLVKDVDPDTDPVNPQYLTNVGGTLFFVANSFVISGQALWKSDGTAAGTLTVKEFHDVLGTPLTNVNGILFFDADDGVHGDELWKSDGTASGTVLVKDIVPGAGGSNLHFLTNMSGTAYFVANDGTHGDELWKSDGTASGTVLVKDIVPGIDASYPENLSNVNGTLFFVANDGLHGYELWKSDGTEAGTVLVKDIVPGIDSSYPGALTNVNGTLFFVVNDGLHGYELWKSDGTEAGTMLVKDIVPGIDGSFPNVLTNVNGTVYFFADDGINGSGLWKSDGTEAGTVLVKTGLYNLCESHLVNVNGTLIFSADDGTDGCELWKSDGTEAGTVLVGDINPGSDGSDPGQFTPFGGCQPVFFSARSAAVGTELWAFLPDGTSCDDGNACTLVDMCQGGTCLSGAPVVCASSDPCHLTGTCDTLSGQCSNPAAPDGTVCNTHACREPDTCQGGICQSGAPVVCTASDQCHDPGTCDPLTGLCGDPPKANGTVCSDGNACTLNDTCQSGTCTAGAPVVCTAMDQCHVAGTCNAATGLCSNPSASDGTACNDGNACTHTDTCQSGTCAGSNPVICAASDQCHDPGTCDPLTGQCGDPPKANGTVCNDGNACTINDTCQSGTCTAGAPVVCTAMDQCHVAGTCNAATGLCSNPSASDGTACNDGNACTHTDTCQSGTCAGSNPVICAASDQCHDVGTCNPSTGLCGDPPKANGTVCNDGNACTLNDTCQSGTCTAGAPVVCTAMDQCHVAGTCNAATGQCSDPTAPDGTACNDGNACTHTDTCQSGTCAGSNPVICVASDQCHDVGTCNPSTGLCGDPPKANGTVCNDGNACTLNDSCQSGTCTAGAPVVCTAMDQCHIAGTCNAATGQCSNPTAPNGSACNDSNACTLNDTCQNGTCTAGAPVVCTAMDQCHTAGICDAATGQCSNPSAPDGTACNDSDTCTQTDMCVGGDCVGSNPFPGCDPAVIPLAPADGSQIFADSPAPDFTWRPGTHALFKLEWSSTEAFAKGTVVTSGIWRNTDSYMPSSNLLKRILRLGLSNGVIYWRVSAKDGAAVSWSAPVRIILGPAQPSTVSGPEDGASFSATGAPPEFTWDTNHNSGFRVIFSAFSTLATPRIVVGGPYSLRTGTFTPTAGQWTRIYKQLATKNGGGTVYYAVEANDALGRKTRSAVRSFTITQ